MFDNCQCLFPWKREAEAEKEPESCALGAPDSDGDRIDCTLFSSGSPPQAEQGRLELPRKWWLLLESTALSLRTEDAEAGTPQGRG